MQEIVYHKNYELESSYWWFVARNKIIYKIIKNKTDLRENEMILDAGCGTGGFSEFMSRHFRMIGLDTSSIALEYAKKRGLVHLFNTTLGEFPKEEWAIRAITMLDVLEHIDDDLEAMRQAYDLLPPGGWLIATVPAYMWLWSRHDEMHMHKRRYNLREFREKLQNAGFDIEYSSYFNTLLFIPAVIKRMMNRVFNQSSDQPVDEVAPWLNKVFTGIFGFESTILPALKFPMGLSIICIARKPK
ncbi:MAG: class I SAM-dependent DNA methyltransferase [Candidatus Kapaibacterium sp.]